MFEKMIILMVLAAAGGCAQGDGTLEEVDPASLPEVVTWVDHIEPILDRYCATCHSDAADVGRLSGYDYGTYLGSACQFGGVVNTFLEGGSMPPGAAPRPDGRQSALLRQWRAQGYPESLDANGQAVKPPRDCSKVGRGGD